MEDKRERLSKAGLDIEGLTDEVLEELCHMSDDDLKTLSNCQQQLISRPSPGHGNGIF